ncbi:lipopolysaccharide biosynthesis protein [Acutalibacter sp. 1XD8-33]|uniref:lipopolysaccharide biosynthesis protein n=1 Tax=Acutalibacter sp. 1XD8-33 TaxID=2320081 RepID=UPI000EA2E7BE|nr:lipopolysaccharide biosynthesis protein [Acutalibacter sp. 1XD8-33]RKJ41784.1 lipopolysaccharide biosynthesis protein [Acutalibacter sp. 1XD8-33]
MKSQKNGQAPPQQKTRAEYSAINATVGMVAQAVSILMGYIGRMVFTRTLSESYVGINGLFGDILGILSLSEMGIGMIMNYDMYRPVAQGDISMQQVLLRVRKRLYQGIAACILVFGLALLPFLQNFTGNISDVEHLYLIYLLYLCNSASSYLLTYKHSLIVAHQKEYIPIIYRTVFQVVTISLQIAVLVTTGDFIAYLTLGMVSSVLCSLCITRQAERMYPYLREKSTKRLPEEEKAKIVRDVKAMALHKVGEVTTKNTDSLLISSFVGISSVGAYSNNNLIIGSVRQIIAKAFNGITASVGNLAATEDSEALYAVFRTAFFISQWLYGFSAICLYELLPTFVELSFGPQYVLDRPVLLVLCLNFFLIGIRGPGLTVWNSMGMFWIDRYKALGEALVNLIASLILVQYWGMLGVFAGTLVSTLLVPLWIEPCLLFRHCLKRPVGSFFRTCAGYFVVLSGVWWIIDILCGQITGGLIETLALRLLICGGVGNGLLLAAHFWREEFKTARWVLSLFIKREKKQ